MVAILLEKYDLIIKSILYNHLLAEDLSPDVTALKLEAKDWLFSKRGRDDFCRNTRVGTGFLGAWGLLTFPAYAPFFWNVGEAIIINYQLYKLDAIKYKFSWLCWPFMVICYLETQKKTYLELSEKRCKNSLLTQ